MNFKLVSVAAALAVSAAVAQDYDDEYEDSAAPAAEEPAREEAAPAPAPAPAAPAAEDSWDKSAAAPAQEAAAPAEGLNVLHSNAYNVVGNEAGAATINGDMSMPHKMAGRTLLYVEPSAREGVLSLAKGGMTYLLEYSSVGPAQITAGIATAGFGVTVDLALAKQFNSEETSTQAGSRETSTSTTSAGDNIGVNVSANLGAFDFGAHASWQTFQDETDTETDNSETDQDYWNINIAAALSNAPSAKGIFWTAGLALQRHSSTVETTTGNQTVETTDPDSRFTISPSFSLGFAVASVANAQLYVGTNTVLPIVIYDEIKDANSKNNRSEFGLYTVPNMLAEVSLTENWMLFGGAQFTWTLFDRLGSETKAELQTTDKSTIEMNTKGALANVGARFAYKNIALEASVSQAVSLDSFTANMGAFIHF